MYTPVNPSLTIKVGFKVGGGGEVKIIQACFRVLHSLCKIKKSRLFKSESEGFTYSFGLTYIGSGIRKKKLDT